MNTSINLRIIVIGCTAIMLLTGLRFITQTSPKRIEHPSHRTESNSMPTEQRLVFYVDPVTNDIDALMEPYQPVPVTIKYDLRGTNEMSLINKMNMTLQELGIEKDILTVQRLVAARASADWSKMPDSWKAAPDVAAWQAVLLKRKISKLLDTADPLTIQRILETDLGGITVPPMEDFEVREGDDAVWREAEAIKARQ